MRADKRYAYRSAVTGRWVKASYARRYPHLTVRVALRPRCGDTR